MTLNKSEKIFFGIAIFWYFSFLTGLYYFLQELFPVEQQPDIGKLLTYADLLVLFALLLAAVANLITFVKKKEWKKVVVTIGIVTLPSLWIVATLYDTFILFG